MSLTARRWHPERHEARMQLAVDVGRGPMGNQSSPAGDCYIDCCGRPATQAGLCYGHRKRLFRGQAVDVLLKEFCRDPLDRLMNAAAEFNDCSSDDEGAFERAKHNLSDAARQYTYFLLGAPKVRGRYVLTPDLGAQILENRIRRRRSSGSRSPTPKGSGA